MSEKEIKSEETEEWDAQQTSEAGCSTDVPQQQQTKREGNPLKQRHSQKRLNSTDVQEQLLSILQEPSSKPPEDELDECHHFALSLVPILYRLDNDGRQQAKLIILHTLHNLEKGNTLL